LMERIYNNKHIKKMYLLFVSALVLIILHSTGCIFQSDNSSSSVIPPESVVELGEGWATNTVNTVIFRHHGLVTFEDYQFTAFYNQEREMCLVKRNLDSGNTETYCMPGEYDTFDAHNSISLGLDRDGYLHISYDHHGHELNYRITKEPFSIENWTEEKPMTGKHEDRVTYPTFIMPYNIKEPGPLMFLYRDGSSSSGNARLKKYDESSKEWQDYEQPVLKGAGLEPWSSNPYWNHPAVDDEDNLHLSFVWRTHSLGEESRINNINVDYAYSPDWGESWYSSNNKELRVPVTQVNSETVHPVSPGSNLINQCSSAVDSEGRPHIVYYSNDPEGIPQYQHLWFDGNRWRHSYISQRSDDFDLKGSGTLQIPISRPEVVIDKEDNVYVIFRGDLTEDRMAVKRLTPPDYKPPAEKRILWDESVEFAEPVIDRLYWEEANKLSMLIQKNGQPPHDAEAPPRAEPVYIVDWELTKGW